MAVFRRCTVPCFTRSPRWGTGYERGLKQTKQNTNKHTDTFRDYAKSANHCKKNWWIQSVNTNNVKRINLPALYAILNFMVKYLLVSTRHLNISFWIHYAIHLARCCSWKFHKYVWAVYCLFVTVTILLKKDNTTNIITQLCTVHCRRRKDGITNCKLFYHEFQSLIWGKKRKFGIFLRWRRNGKFVGLIRFFSFIAKIRRAYRLNPSACYVFRLSIGVTCGDSFYILKVPPPPPNPHAWYIFIFCSPPSLMPVL